MQNSLLSTSQYQPTNNYLSNQGGYHDPWMNSNRPSVMTTSATSNGGTGYQSIIGRRRFVRYDDVNSYLEHTSVGDAYTASVFANPQDPYATTNHYMNMDMNMSDQPPVIPPRLRRTNYRNDEINDQYRRHSIDEYLSDNVNNNNNNNNQALPKESFIHYAHPATITNTNEFQPINADYNQQYDPSFQEQDDLRHRTQSTSSTNSSDSIKQQRSARTNNIRTPMNNQPRLPPSSLSLRTNIQQNERKTNEKLIQNKSSPTNGQPPTSTGLNNSAFFS